jgi:hypothetical protein
LVDSQQVSSPARLVDFYTPATSRAEFRQRRQKHFILSANQFMLRSGMNSRPWPEKRGYSEAGMALTVVRFDLQSDPSSMPKIAAAEGRRNVYSCERSKSIAIKRIRDRW